MVEYVQEMQQKSSFAPSACGTLQESPATSASGLSPAEHVHPSPPPRHTSALSGVHPAGGETDGLLGVGDPQAEPTKANATHAATSWNLMFFGFSVEWSILTRLEAGSRWGTRLAKDANPDHAMYDTVKLPRSGAARTADRGTR